MNQQAPETTVSSNNAISGSNRRVKNSNAAYDAVLSEKRSQWLFRIQFCLFLSVLAHIALLAYVHDKFILLKTSLVENRLFPDVDKAEPVPMPVQEPRAVSGYSESRLDSPEVQDSFEQLTPTSPAEEQEFNDEKSQPAADDFNSSIEHEFQTPDSPELSDIPNVSPISVNELKTPTEDVQPDLSRTYNTEFNPSNMHKSIPLPEHEPQISAVEHEQPQSDFGSMGQQTAIIADSSQVVLKAGDTESIRPTIYDPTILNLQNDASLAELSNQMPEQSVSSVPDQIRPVMSDRPNNYIRAKETAILAKASSNAPQAQTRMPISEGSRGLPRSNYDSSTTYKDQTAKDISHSIVLESPQKATSVPIPRDFNAGFGGLNGEEFKSLETLPESSVSIGALSIISIDRNDASPSEAYKKRDPALRPQMITSYGGDAAINQTIENGLKYVSQTQWPDGHWSFHQQPASIKASQKLQQNGSKKCDTAATSMALLSMLGAGYTHKDGPYKEEIQKGLNYLIEQQQTVPVVGTNGIKGAVGAIYDKDDLNNLDETQVYYNYSPYAHAMATIALCEAYGMTHDPNLLPPAQAAARYIIATQNPHLGGWRYETPGQEGQPHLESDTSSSGWQIMALRSAMAAEVLKPEEVVPVLNKAQHWLERAQHPETKRYIYNPDIGNDPKYTDWRKTTPAMTAEGLFMQWCINPDLVDSQQTIPYLLQNAPGKKGDSDYTRDVYYWYYGTAVMFAQKGEAWKKWQSVIMPLLRDSQLPANHPCAGSWDTESPSIDKWSNVGGKHYITTMNLMIMEVYIRHLGIFQ